MRFIRYILPVLILLFISGKSYAQKNKEILNLNLKTSENLIYNFSSIKNSKATVYIFFLTDCPASQNYTLTINKLQKKYSDKDIPFVIIFPDTYSTIDEILDFKKKYKIQMPIVLDPELAFTKLLSAKVAPQCFVLDRNATIIYEGRIDDWYYSPGKKRTVIRSNDLDVTLTNFLAGKPIDPAKTIPYGCVINY
ncbi:MAG: redoxin family protein [Bacteroidia bacterium]|nr:redoxin family protein [Bacteroidia bacterium]